MRKNRASIDPVEIQLPKFSAFTVTAGDIKHGVQGSPSSCPIALAITRELKLKGITPASVDVGAGSHNYTIEVPIDIVLGTLKRRIIGQVEVHLDLGTKADAFLKAFDDGETVRPMTLHTGRIDVETGDFEEVA